MVGMAARAVSPVARISPARSKTTMRWELRRSRPRRTSVGLPERGDGRIDQPGLERQAPLEFVLEIAL